MHAVTDKRHVKKAQGKYSSSFMSCRFTSWSIVYLMSLKCAQGREMMRGQKVKQMEVIGSKQSRSSELPVFEPTQTPTTFAGRHSANPPNYIKTIFKFINHLSILQWKKIQENFVISLFSIKKKNAFQPAFYNTSMQQETYKTHSGEALAITEIQARVLKNKTNWKILFDKEWESLLSMIKECDIQVLQITGPQDLSMLACIQQIKFGYLLQLNLYNIELCTTESILSMKTPRLQYLRLSNNKLSNIKSLRKISFPELKELLLYNNRIVDTSPLVEIHSRQQLQIMLFRFHKKPLTFTKGCYDTNDIEDYSCMFKLNKKVELGSRTYIKCLNQQKIRPMLVEKFKSS